MLSGTNAQNARSMHCGHSSLGAYHATGSPAECTVQPQQPSDSQFDRLLTVGLDCAGQLAVVQKKTRKEDILLYRSQEITRTAFLTRLTDILYICWKCSLPEKKKEKKTMAASTSKDCKMQYIVLLFLGSLIP